MSTTTNLQYVQPHVARSRQVDHYADLACAVVRAADDHDNVVTLFFTARAGAHELEAAEQWLREALEAVQDAKHARATKQSVPFAAIGEPIDLTANPLVTGCQATSSSGYRCTLTAGHYAEHVDQRSVVVWSNPDDVRVTA